MSIKTKPDYILVDGSSYLFRAYFALPPLTNSKDMPTGAIFGVVNMLRKLIKSYPESDIIVVFDAKEKTFRHDLYSEYKANRPEMADDLQVQIKPLHDIIRAMGLPLIIQPGYEADDIIGALAQQAAKKKQTTLVSTSDKDMAQLVNDHVMLVNTMTDRFMDKEGVFEKFQVYPEQIIDYLTLIGDTVDNIPGVPKVGPKTAAKWLGEYKTLDNIVDNSLKIKGKVGEYFREAIPHLPLYKQLVTIDCDMELNCGEDGLSQQSPNILRLESLYTQLEFKSWVSLLQKDLPKKEERVTKDYQVIFKKDQLESWLKRIKENKKFAFDTETTSLDALNSTLVGVSFALADGDAAYLPLQHDYEGAPEQLNYDWVLAELKKLLEDESMTVVGQNLKYDFKVLYRKGIAIKAKMLDTLLMSYVVNSTGKHDLDTLASEYLERSTISFIDIAGKGVKQLGFNQIEIEKAAPYAAEDAEIAWLLSEKFSELLQDMPEAKVLLETVELPLLPVLAEMECLGVLIDEPMLQEQSKALSKKLDHLQKNIFAACKQEFNMDSPKQLQEVLYEKLELPVLKKTAKGQPSTAEAVLQQLADEFPMVNDILLYRSLMKLKSTYTDRLPEQVDESTGRIHTSYMQAVTSTGRLSSKDPNLQNIPVRTEEGRKIRQAFIAGPGKVVLSADYSQIELRLMAHFSQDEGLVKAFANNLDIHQATAAEVFATPLAEVTTEQRRRAKAINFGLLYGMSAFGLAQQLDISRTDAQSYIDTYFARYPAVLDYLAETKESAKKMGYVTTLCGRRLYVPEIQSRNPMRRKAAERAAINAPLQGSAADMIKLAMIHVNQWLSEADGVASMVMQVHDELVFEVDTNSLAQVTRVVKDLMENVVDLRVPIQVSAQHGKNWDEAH